MQDLPQVDNTMKYNALLTILLTCTNNNTLYEIVLCYSTLSKKFGLKSRRSEKKMHGANFPEKRR